LSPEQARGGMANRKSDIYSLGIVMFELLTGRLPFSGESAVSIALKHLQSETPSVRRWNPNVPQSVENIVLKATAKDSFHRYNSVDEMEDDLRTALDSERLDEAKFVIPIDDEATKAIPVITNERPFQNLDETLIHSQDKNNGNVVAVNNGKEQKKRKKWPIILISTFILLALLGLFTVTLLPELIAPKDITIPDVSGMELDEAITKIELAGLQVDEEIESPHDELEEGRVIKTNPEEGSTVKEDTSISIYVSIGKEKFELSDYTDRKYDDVIRFLENKNFKDIEITEVFDDSEPGTILSQNPESGEEVVPEETILEFEVSKGPEKIILKDLKQSNTKGAQDYVDSVGLTLDASEEKYDDTIPAGNIISQSPEPGTEMKKGDTVSVVISKGKEEKPPKLVPVEILIEYTGTEPGQEQNVLIYIEDINHSMTTPAETFSITSTIKRTIELLVPFEGEAGYKVYRGNTVLYDVPVEYPK
jgi:serine/threonine-protein kinase